MLGGIENGTLLFCYSRTASQEDSIEEAIVKEKNPTLSTLIDQVNESNQPIFITIENNKKAVLVSLEEWQSIQETLYLISIPRVKEDLIEGMEIAYPLKN